MKIFTVNFTVYYLSGNMFIVAETKRKAFNKAKKKISEMKLDDRNDNFTMENVEEIDLNNECVIVLNNGDY